MLSFKFFKVLLSVETFLENWKISTAVKLPKHFSVPGGTQSFQDCRKAMVFIVWWSVVKKYFELSINETQSLHLGFWDVKKSRASFLKQLQKSTDHCDSSYPCTSIFSRKSNINRKALPLAPSKNGKLSETLIFGLYLESSVSKSFIIGMRILK